MLVDIWLPGRTGTLTVIFDAFLRFLLFCPSTTHFPLRSLLCSLLRVPTSVFSSPVLLHR